MFVRLPLRRHSLVIALAWSVAMLLHAVPSEAKLFRLPADDEPQIRTAGYEEVEVLPAPSTEICCPDYCVTYRAHHRLKKICCGCPKPINVMLDVPDPLRCGCSVEVPLCIPGCCEDAPCVDKHCGLFGRGYVTYTWKCGYKVTVAFLVHKPTVVVHTYGS